ncbi:MAG TPA: alpha/beta family hydrolase [Hyphomicrobiaceae bacterium]|nr:alpha/beta family hydrolase [Hyphomicrobiaceae bacterium]
MLEFVVTGPAAPRGRFLCAHGAGAGMASPFLSKIAALLAERDLATHRFEFHYMSERRRSGRRTPPPRAERLTEEVVAAVMAMPPGPPVLIGGKSMGGRVASLVADRLSTEGRVCGLVCLGYPFHPPKQPAALRTAHLERLRCPTLIIQGERDPFGSRDEVTGYPLSSAITVVWASDGDHDLGPRGASGHTRAGNLAAAADAIVRFAERVGAG